MSKRKGNLTTIINDKNDNQGEEIAEISAGLYYIKFQQKEKPRKTNKYVLFPRN